MSNPEKPSFLTRAMINVDKKMNRTPAEGEVATTESKADVKNALIGAGLVAAVTVSFVLAFKTIVKSTVEEVDPSTEIIED